MLVNFMIIGAQKCGTTSLAEQLARHPQVCFCRNKEPGFFNKAADWRGGLAAYHQLYRPLAGQLCGEASTMYTFFPEYAETPARLHRYNPQLKLIYLMRQPVERVISNFAHDLVRQAVKGAPETVVLQNPSYVNRSRYGLQLRPYLELFSSDQLLPLVFEEYTENQAGTLHQIASFLGIAADGFAQQGETHAHRTVGESQLKSATLRTIVRSGAFQTVRNLTPLSLRQPVRRLLSTTLTEKPLFSPALRSALWRLLEDDVAFVEQLLGRPLAGWRRGYHT